MEGNKPRVTQRVPKSCLYCRKKRIKCNKVIPCDVCIKRNLADSCCRETVIVKGVTYNEKQPVEDKYAALMERVKLLEKRNIQLTEQLKGSRKRKANIVVKKDIDFYATAINLVTMNHQEIPQVEVNYDDFDTIAEFITEEVSRKIIDFNLSNIYFIHMAIFPPAFTLEHDEFWSSPGPKHITNKIDRGREEYLWTAIWYAMISAGLHLLDDTLIEEIFENHPPAIVFKLAEIASLATLECLHRGQFLKYPNIKSIQAYCILASCFHGFAGIHLQNTLLGSMIYIGKTLNLHLISEYYSQDEQPLTLVDQEVGCRLWWVLCIIDWLEEYNRSSIISIDDFTTPIPRNITDRDLINGIDKETDTFLPVTYIKAMCELACIKRTYYFDSQIEISEITIESLRLADDKILRLEKKFVLSATDQLFPIFLLTFSINLARFEIGTRILSCIPKDNWETKERITCLNCAENILKLVIDDTVPTYYKKFWIISNVSSVGATFLILDILITEPLTENDERLNLIKQFLVAIEPLKHSHRIVNNYLVLIKPFMDLILEKNSQINSSQFAKIYDYLKRLKTLPKIYGEKCVKQDIQIPQGIDLLKKNIPDNVTGNLADTNSTEEILKLFLG